MVIPQSVVTLDRIEREIEAAKRKLGPEVVRLSYTLREDHAGEPSIYFRIVLSDAASEPRKLGDVTGGIVRGLEDTLVPISNWGMRAYYSFRSQSEQARLTDASWR